MAGPSVLQSAVLCGNAWPITLPAKPTAGNLLVCICSQFTVSGAVAQNGWTLVGTFGPSNPGDVGFVLTKVATASDAAAQSPLSDSNPRGRNAAIFEIAGEYSSVTAAGNAQATGYSGTVSLTAATAGAVALGFAGTTGSQELATPPSGWTLRGQTTGTSSSVSPRAVTAASIVASAPGAVSWAPTWSVSSSIYVLGAVVNAGTPDLRVSEQAAFVAFENPELQVSEQVAFVAFSVPLSGLQISEQVAFVAISEPVAPPPQSRQRRQYYTM